RPKDFDEGLARCRSQAPGPPSLRAAKPRYARLGGLALLLQFLVDDGLELVDGLGADDLGAAFDDATRGATDEEGGRPAGADGGALLGLGVDLVLELAAVERGLELRHVEAELLGVLLKRRAVEGLLVREELVVHLPELALLVGRQRRL